MTTALDSEKKPFDFRKFTWEYRPGDNGRGNMIGTPGNHASMSLMQAIGESQAIGRKLKAMQFPNEEDTVPVSLFDQNSAGIRQLVIKNITPSEWGTLSNNTEYSLGKGRPSAVALG